MTALQSEAKALAKRLARVNRAIEAMLPLLEDGDDAPVSPPVPAVLAASEQVAPIPASVAAAIVVADLHQKIRFRTRTSKSGRGPDVLAIIKVTIETLEKAGRAMNVGDLFDAVVQTGVDFGELREPRRTFGDLLWRRSRGPLEPFESPRTGYYALRAPRAQLGIPSDSTSTNQAEDEKRPKEAS